MTASGTSDDCTVTIRSTLTNDLPGGTRSRLSGLQAELATSTGEEIPGWISGWKTSTSGDFVLSATTVDDEGTGTRPYCGTYQAAIKAHHTLLTDSKAIAVQGLMASLMITCCWWDEAGGGYVCNA